MDSQLTTSGPKAVYTLPSILSIIAAAGSFLAGAGGGFLLAITAIVLGVVGLLASVLPGRRGGLVSLSAIFLGAMGVILAFVKLLI